MRIRCGNGCAQLTFLFNQRRNLDCSRAIRRSKRKAVAAEAPEIGEALAGCFGCGKKLQAGVSAPLLMICVGVLVLQNGDAGASGMFYIQGRTIAAEFSDGRPFGQHGQTGRREVREVGGSINDFASDDGELGFEVFDLVVGNGHVVIGEDGEVGELAVCDGTFSTGFIGEPTAALGVEAQGFFAAEAVGIRIHGDATDGLAGDEPVKGNPRVVTGDAGGRGRSNTSGVVANELTILKISVELLERPSSSRLISIRLERLVYLSDPSIPHTRSCCLHPLQK
ncbi:MAG: hypothetical protein JWO95_2717 [Verrucomicrobiales bacterium]|nr:hypothetical protein [Verrucomicrobiales bacterium]